jgi:thioredoxin
MLASNQPLSARPPAARPLVHRCSTITLLRATKRTYGSFDELLSQSAAPVLVDFFAVWCGPCLMLAPILGEVAAAFGEKLTVAKVDTDKYPALASRFNVSALPTLILFKEGKPVDRIEGLPEKQQLIDRVRRWVS